ncbi:MAG TPA: hypothetical protein VK154_04980 [Chitinophagales bacterium]|nr:hypothetical protein [Chitinophagales bacterium]
MKKIFSLILLSAILITGESFTSKKAAERYAPGYALTVDGADFVARATGNYNAQLTNNSKTASITLLGEEVRDKQGHVYPSKIQIDYTFKEGMLGEVNVENMSYEYNNQKYNALPGTAFVSVTKMKWSTDKKSFALSADVFCKVQRSFVMEENVPVFVIRGQIQNLQVNAPAL